MYYYISSAFLYKRTVNRSLHVYLFSANYSLHTEV